MEKVSSAIASVNSLRVFFAGNAGAEPLGEISLAAQCETII